MGRFAPWETQSFWIGVTTVGGAGAVLFSALWALAESSWVEKPARESQVVEVQKSVAGLKERVDQADERARKIEEAISSIAQNLAAMSEAQRRTAEQVGIVGRQINELSITLIRKRANGGPETEK